MRLPVIQTCGECAFCHTTSVCMHPRAHPVYEIDGFAKPPPSWCPLRTGPDTERIAALEAVASSADAYRQKRTGAGPLDAAIRHLRRLT